MYIPGRTTMPLQGCWKVDLTEDHHCSMGAGCCWIRLLQYLVAGKNAVSRWMVFQPIVHQSLPLPVMSDSYAVGGFMGLHISISQQ
jgi:hypothetical protein